jgi:hypothetical protein
LRRTLDSFSGEFCMGLTHELSGVLPENTRPGRPERGCVVGEDSLA